MNEFGLPHQQRGNLCWGPRAGMDIWVLIVYQQIMARRQLAVKLNTIRRTEWQVEALVSYVYHAVKLRLVYVITR